MIYQSFYFTDVVSGKSVNIYKDRFGKKWMSDGKWGLTRIEIGD